MPRTQGFNRTRATGGGGGENKCVFTFNEYDSLSLFQNNYCPINGGGPIAQLVANESRSQQVISKNGTLQNLYARVLTAPGVGNSWIITVRVNGVNTLLTCTIAGAATASNNTAIEIPVVAGDLISVEWDPVGPANEDVASHSIELVID
jgi:hypothetical protein